MAGYVINPKSAFQTIAGLTVTGLLDLNRATYLDISNRCKMAGYLAPPPASDQPAFAPIGAISQFSLIPAHSRLIWLKFFRDTSSSMDGRDQFFHPWSRSATTEGDLEERGKTSMGELLSQRCRLQKHRFETSGPWVSIDLTHDIVVLDNYHQMCVETFGWQPKDPAAKDFGQISVFSRFLISIEQMLKASHNPRIDRWDYRHFWGPLGEGKSKPPISELPHLRLPTSELLNLRLPRPELSTSELPILFILMDKWNPEWVKNQEKAEWASDLLVVNGVWELSEAFQKMVEEIEPLLQLVGGKFNVEYCHWETLHS